jgi:hypothetical protein
MHSAAVLLLLLAAGLVLVRLMAFARVAQCRTATTTAAAS